MKLRRGQGTLCPWGSEEGGDAGDATEHMGMRVAGQEHHTELRQWPLGNREGRWVCCPSDSRSGGGTFLPSVPFCYDDRLNMLYPHAVAALFRQWPQRNPRASAYPKGCVDMSNRLPVSNLSVSMATNAMACLQGSSGQSPGQWLLSVSCLWTFRHS